MSKNASFLVQTLDKLGGPLLQAVASVRNNKNGETTPQNDAEKTAALLSKTIQLSLDLGKDLELDAQTSQSDAVRVALAGITSPLIGNFYKSTQDLPSDADLEKILKSVQAVLIFADKFTLSDEDIGRVEQSHAGVFSDETQTTVQYIHALTPMISAVSRFSFGQDPSALVQTIASKLGDRAEKLRQSIISGDLDPYQEKQAELTILRTLSELYAACHIEQTEKMTNLQTDGAPLNAETTWDLFEIRASMLDALSKGFSNENTAGAAAQPAAQATAPAAPTPPPAEQAPAAPTEQPSAPAAPASPPADQGGSPFSSFKKDDAPASPPAAPSQPAEQPAAAPPVQQTPAEPAPPPAEPPAAPASDEGEDEGSSGDSGSASPFSSFVKKDG